MLKDNRLSRVNFQQVALVAAVLILFAALMERKFFQVTTQEQGKILHLAHIPSLSAAGSTVPSSTNSPEFWEASVQADEVYTVATSSAQFNRLRVGQPVTVTLSRGVFSGAINLVSLKERN